MNERVPARIFSMKPAPPHFESVRLQEIASAMERRGKAIRYHGRLECSREMEDTGERLNIDFAATLHFRVRLSIWADGVFWLGITEPGPRRTGGWAHCYAGHGDLTGLDAHEVLERFEQTIHSPTEAHNFWPVSSNEANSV
jgi:hypothetical protein